MDQILDLDEQPPYVELYSHAPLMYMSLNNQRHGCTQTSPKEMLCWSHGVQCKIDDIASGLGLYKIKVLGNRGTSCLFAISPDMPPKQQAHIMFTAARQLQQVLAQVLLPGGDAMLASQITIHAGKYAGGIVGKGSWSYDLFGQDVHVLLDMDLVNRPNCIQVSDPALALLAQLKEQFTPACKVVCSGGEVAMHRWTHQAPEEHQLSPTHLPVIDLQSPDSTWQQQQQLLLHSEDEEEAGDAAAVTLLKQHVLAPLKQKHGASRRQHLPRSAFAGGDSAPHTEHDSRPGSSSGRGGQARHRSHLRFPDIGLEAAFVSCQARQLARLDMLFVAVTLLISGSFVASTWGRLPAGQLLVSSLAQWLVPVAAAAWYVTRPDSYSKWREPLWVLHRVLSSINLVASVVACMLQHKALVQQAGSAAAAAVEQRMAAMLRREAVTMLADNLGFKVRFRVQLITAAFNAAVAILGVLWQCNTSSQLLWDLLLRVAVGCAAPTLLIYLWETEERGWFVAGGPQRADRGSMPVKAKQM